MAVLISKYKEALAIKDEIIKNYKKQVNLMELMMEYLKNTIGIYQKEIDILQEELMKEKSRNETMAQGSDQLSSAAAGDSSVEGAVSDSGASGEGSHT